MSMIKKAKVKDHLVCCFFESECENARRQAAAAGCVQQRLQCCTPANNLQQCR